ncbi:MAG: UDP-N-acetylmuramoyl-L-alanine--D-glutamate ligase, partial [Lachnospiraceae bacterium]|nr:UDP-N-acetylmuramoyl-L-alanine--D-glutamate ligase [Lachnospiraceae bacterium]
MDSMCKPVLVAGAGISGIQAAGLLGKMGREAILYDGNTEKDREELKKALPEGTEIVLGELPDDVVKRVSLCVISPGISLEVPFVQKLREAGIEIIGEIELAYRYEKGTVIGITGTNGKTTTTTLVGDIMRAYLGEDRAFTVGNIGHPYTEEVLRSTPESVSTIELSSFQLETVKTFHAKVSAILNITPDHLNRHHTMECYTEVKERVAMNSTKEDTVVLNAEDPRLLAFSETTTATPVLFSGLRTLSNGYFLRDNTLYYAEDGRENKLLTTDEVNLVGRCNYENILAAVAITRAMGVPMSLILDVVRNFKAVPHRIEFVEEVNGVRYYNDSKGTNPDAAIQAVRAMTRPTVLLGGGYDKGSEFDEWIEEFGTTVKELILIGATREKIAECCRAHGFTAYSFADTFEEAFSRAVSLAVPGDAVLLSPACASWGMF